MAKTYIKELQEKIEALDDWYDIHNLEISLLESELHNTTKPSNLISEQMMLHLQMFDEVITYCKTKKVTDRITASKTRLLRLIDISTQLNGIGDTAIALKRINKELVSRIQLLRVENHKLKTQLSNVIKSHEEL